MSIEGGGVSGGGGGMGGIGSAVSVGLAPSAGPAFAGLSFGGEMSSFSIGASLVNEGPVGGSFSFAEFKPLGVPGFVNEGPLTPASLESSVALQVNSIDLITEQNFNSLPEGNILEPMLAQSVIAEVESILFQAQKPAVFSPLPADATYSALQVGVIPANAGIQLVDSRSDLDPALRRDDQKAEPQVQPIFFESITDAKLLSRQPMPQILPILEPMPLGVAYLKVGTIVEEAEAIAQNAWEVYPIAQSEPAANSLDAEEPVALVDMIPEQIESEVLVKEQEEEKQPEEAFDEELILEQKVYLEDEVVSAQRKHEIREAILKARKEADRLGFKKITGWLVAKFLPGEHEGNRSQVVKKTGPDGSYQETIEEVAGVGELESAEQAVIRLNAIVDDKQPVRFGKEGKRVKPLAVARVYKFRMVKPVQPRAEVIKRIVKKKDKVVAPVSLTDWKSKKESSLEELGLSDVFQKAA